MAQSTHLIRALICTFLVCATYTHALADSFGHNLSNAALERTKHNVRYDGRYISIPYPNGDVPADMGVCTDVVIRSYRTLGTDLQKEVHEDMHAHFQEYPKIWGLRSTDTNIDHRRVPNLETFFERKGTSLPLSNIASDFLPGDLVTWRLNGSNLPHIGIVTDKKTTDGTPLIVHNIGAGPKLENMIFEHKMIGHYRYTPHFSP